jgi:hypothetical protein
MSMWLTLADADKTRHGGKTDGLGLPVASWLVPLEVNRKPREIWPHIDTHLLRGSALLKVGMSSREAIAIMGFPPFAVGGSFQHVLSYEDATLYLGDDGRVSDIVWKK